MGTGYFSTLVLRWLCEMSGRTLYSYEGNQQWYERALKKSKPYHHIIYAPNFDEAPIERPWGLVFIDHGPNERRRVDIARLAPYAEMMVIHDTNPETKPSKHGYGYDAIWPLFAYRYDFTLYDPWTSVVSNTIDVSKLFK